MKHILSRREFLKTSGAFLAGLALAPGRGLTFFAPTPPVRVPDPFARPPQQDQGLLGRVASFQELDVHAKPRDDAQIVGKRYRDQIIHIYDEVIPKDAPLYYNRLWYSVWGGYLHSAHIQEVRILLNEPASQIPETGILAEVTVPFTTAYQFKALEGWIPWRGSRMYYTSTHWLTGVQEGPDGKPWYRITSELSKSEIYFAPAHHLRLIPAEEYAPISVDVPVQNKRIEVSLSEQKLRAFEFDTEVFSARISSGIPTPRINKDTLPTATPTGRHRISAPTGK